MKIAALSLVALASTASAFAPASVSRNGVSVQSSLTESFELGSIESEVSTVFPIATWGKNQ